MTTTASCAHDHHAALPPSRAPLTTPASTSIPDEPVLKPDAMEQNLQLEAILGLLRSHFTDFNRRPDVFLDSNTIICYDPGDLNVRVSPDVYLAFGVDAQAIRPRKLYSTLGGRQAAGLGAGDRLVEHWTGGRRPEAGHLCPYWCPGILALRSDQEG